MANVSSKDDKGALVQLPYGLEGFAPARHLAKEDGKTVVAEETLPFVVIEFDRNEKRILLSHSRVWEQAQADVKEAVKKEARVEAEVTKKAVKAVQAKVEKTTLGDIGALAELRAKLEGGEVAAKAESTKVEEAKAETEVTVEPKAKAVKAEAKVVTTEAAVEPTKEEGAE